MITAPLPVTEPEYRRRLIARLRAPSAPPVVKALYAAGGEPLSAGAIAATAYLSTSAVRVYTYVLMQLGYAVQTQGPCASNGRAVAMWTLTDSGVEYAKGIVRDVGLCSVEDVEEHGSAGDTGVTPIGRRR